MCFPRSSERAFLHLHNNIHNFKTPVSSNIQTNRLDNRVPESPERSLIWRSTSPRPSSSNQKLTYQGHVVSLGPCLSQICQHRGYHKSFQFPMTRQKLMRLLEMASWCHRCCWNFPIVTASLSKLIRGEVKCHYCADCQSSWSVSLSLPPWSSVFCWSNFTLALSLLTWQATDLRDLTRCSRTKIH